MDKGGSLNCVALSVGNEICTGSGTQFKLGSGRTIPIDFLNKSDCFTASNPLQKSPLRGDLFNY